MLFDRTHFKLRNDFVRIVMQFTMFLSLLTAKAKNMNGETKAVLIFCGLLLLLFVGGEVLVR